MKLAHMSRRVSLAIVIALATPLVLVGAAVLVLESDWAERKIESFVSERLGRAVELNDIDIRFGWPPPVHLGSLRIANPDWAKTDALVDAEDLTARVEVWPLLRGRVIVDTLQVARGSAGLEQGEGRATWRFGPPDDDKQRSPFVLREARIGKGEIYYANAPEKTALEVRVTGELGPEGGAIEMKAEGTFRGDPAQGTLRAPSLALQSERAIRATLDATVGATSGTFDGTVQFGEAGVGSMDAAVSARGKTLEHLFNFFGLNAPETPPYRLEGRVRHAKGDWTLEPLSGEIGDSDIRGRVVYAGGGKKPALEVDLKSQRLDFDDLAPLVGAPPAAGAGETASPEQKRQARAARQDDALLPDARFETGRWDAMNADVRLVAEEVESDRFPISSLTFHATLRDAVLRVQPFAMGIAGGRVEATLSMDASQKPARGTLELDARKLDLSSLLPRIRSTRVAVGHFFATARLSGRGNSIERLLATAEGKVTAAVAGGQISSLLMEAVGLDLAEALAVIASKNAKTPLRCAVADLEIDSGIARPKAFVIDTRDTLVRVDGTIDLQRERFDLVAHPHPKDPSVFSLDTPLTITGPLGDPSVRPKGGPIAAQVGAAALLALVNPLAAVVPFMDTGSAESANCNALLERAKGAGAQS